MPTGSPLMPRMHLDSHWVSWGHTRPHTAGRLEERLMTSNAPSMSSLASFSMKAGMSIWTGHLLTQGLFLQFMQRRASSMAIS